MNMKKLQISLKLVTSISFLQFGCLADKKLEQIEKVY